MAATLTNLLYHIVFSTKLRVPMITESLEAELYRYMGGIIRGEGGILLAIGGVSDHVHLLVKCKPTIAVADMLRVLKANSSKWINEEKRGLQKFGWQDGYGAFTVSQSQVPHVRRYIRDQKRHHHEANFQNEMKTLLERHGVEYDERYVWD
ncbi:MAG: IS200/IS605 family transposase [Candidatus Binatia bacterium]